MHFLFRELMRTAFVRPFARPVVYTTVLHRIHLAKTERLPPLPDPPQIMEQWTHFQPKGVPRHVRQTFEYFVFTAATASSKDDKDEPEVAKPVGTADTASAADPTGQHAMGSDVGDIVGDSLETAGVSSEAISAEVQVQVQQQEQQAEKVRRRTSPPTPGLESG